MRIKHWLWILPLLLLLSGCATPTSSATYASTFSDGKIFERECLFTVSPDTGRIDLAFSAHLTTGTLRWALIDPLGTTIDFGTVTPNQPLNHGQVFEAPVEGDWVLILRLSAGRGEYSVQWKGY